MHDSLKLKLSSDYIRICLQPMYQIMFSSFNLNKVFTLHMIFKA